jgi:acetyl-CoA carboxylase biotin carboxylase subunit
MFAKVLIANRGEIAVRILRTCRELGIPAVVAFSEPDRESLAVREADEAICIGPAEARRSYLNQPALISAALITGCDAIHPGYGFLSEDASFAEACAVHELVFIGPRAQVIERFASKYAVRRMLAATGLPTVPGSTGIVADLADALAQAETAGYPVLLKPSAGGGGRGMRLVRSPREMETQLPLARSEARAAFGDDSLYFERWIEDNRHVEVQVLVDSHGNGIHLGERDCSVQRRHQKIIEEAPSPAMAEPAREHLRDLAIRSVVAAGYENAGTLEFLLDRDGNFYFIEINCRIQVEHPITEALTGVDLVAEQLRIAAGERLSLTQEQVRLRGHAFEFRITAEDPHDNFSPQVGTASEVEWPEGPGIRVDSHLYAGYEIPPYYDSLLAKLIVWGEDRAEALSRARQALAGCRIEGVKTNLPFHRAIVDNAAFVDAEVSTNLLDRVGPAAFVGEPA